MTLAELTDEQIDAMEAGPEIDSLVLIAIDQRFSVWMQPSRNWNDAMFSAEMFGLFKSGHHERILYQGGGIESPDWRIADDCGSGYADDSIAQTGPLAICRAILKLARK